MNLGLPHLQVRNQISHQMNQMTTAKGASARIRSIRRSSGTHVMRTGLSKPKFPFQRIDWDATSLGKACWCRLTGALNLVVLLLYSYGPSKALTLRTALLLRCCFWRMRTWPTICGQRDFDTTFLHDHMRPCQFTKQNTHSQIRWHCDRWLKSPQGPEHLSLYILIYIYIYI